MNQFCDRPPFTRRSGNLARMVVLMCLCVSGCATYSQVGTVYRERGPNIQVDLPHGWLQFNPARPDYVITRDGLRLEKVTIRAIKMGEKIPNSDRVYRQDMLPQEIAELTLGLIGARDEYNNLAVEAIDLATVLGCEAYKAAAVFTDDMGLRKRLLLYGTAIKGYVCEFIYEAADEVYFRKYADTFEKIVASARKP